jgi:hypothetical protein
MRQITIMISSVVKDDESRSSRPVKIWCNDERNAPKARPLMSL